MRTAAYLCVHGIGVHGSGALAEDVAACMTTAAEELGGIAEPLPAEPDAPAELVHRAQINLPQREPFIAEFYDGWWTRRVRRPRFWTVLLWTLRIAPLTLLNTASLWFRDRVFSRGRSSRGLLTALLPAALFALLAAASVLLLPVLLGLTAAISALRSRAQTVVVDFIGDAWLYRSDELDHSVLPHLTSLARTARSLADTVVLVGHSQGAELTRRAGLRLTRHHPDDGGFRFVWVGSGENQLNTVRALARTRYLPLVFWPYLLGWPLLMHVMLSPGSPLWPEMQPAGRLGAAVLALAVYFVAGVLMTRLISRPPRDMGQLPGGLSWYVQSILDPVSYGSAAVRGPAHRPEAVAVRYVPRHAGRPWWMEHVTYFEKPETGHTLLEAGLEVPEPLAPELPPQVPVWVLALCAAAVAALLGLGWLVGDWQWQLLDPLGA